MAVANVRRAALVVLVSGALACSDGGSGTSSEPDPAELEISPGSGLLESVGDSLRLTATVFDDVGNSLPDAEVTWVSGNAAVVSVSESGVAVALGNGIAQITASSGTATGTVTVEVRQRIVTMLMSPPLLDLGSAGDTMRVHVTAKDRRGHEVTDAPVVWASSNHAVAVVDQAGLVSATGSGSATIVAMAGGIPAFAQANVAVSYRPVQTMSAGAFHTCATPAETGPTHCWGYREWGLLGDGIVSGTSWSSLPVPVSDGRRFDRIAAGLEFTCGLMEIAGEVWCWGSNEYGQLGIPGLAGSAVPARVTLPGRPTDISAGTRHACAVLADNDVVCWGDNEFGQLGDGTLDQRNAPTPVMGLHQVIEVKAGSRQTCARFLFSSVACWGSNYRGALGRGLDEASLPMDPHWEYVDSDPLTYFAPAVGADHGCGIAIGTSWAFCWGSNAYGQAGTVYFPDAVLSPSPIDPHLQMQGLTAGGNFTCAVGLTHRAYCWGDNSGGQLGGGTIGGSTPPGQVVEVDTPVPWQALFAGYSHVCGLTPAGEAYCWGYGRYGQLGDGTFASRARPARVVFPQ